IDHSTCASNTTQPPRRRNLVSFLPFPSLPSLPPTHPFFSLCFFPRRFPIFQFCIFRFAAAGGGRTCLLGY
ncbi:hypothetical protein HOY80DRAFT_861874, partial [Tuber brumale]